jgi:hypothetical protein
MNKKVINILTTIFIIISSFSIMIIFREESSAQIWNKTRIALFPKTCSQDYICSILNQENIKYVCKNSKRIKIPSEMIPINIDDKYLNFQNIYFSDLSGTYNIFYFPDISTHNFKKVLSVLKNAGIVFSTDSKTKYPYITFVFFVISFFIFLYYSKSKLLFSLCSVPLFLLNYSCPFWAQCISSTFVFLILFNLLPDINRKNYVSTYLKSFSSIIYLSIFIIITVISGFKIFIFTCLTIISIFIIYYLYSIVKKYFFNKKNIFEPVFILKADSKKNISKKFIIISFIPFILCFIALFFSITSVSLFQDNSSIKIPSPKKKYGNFCIKNFEKIINTDKIIPDISDYINFAWNSVTLPYHSFNYADKSFPEKNESVYFTDYINTQDGIALNEKIMYTFNDDFLKKSLSFIDSNYPVIEKVLLNQGHFCRIDYSVMSKTVGESSMTVKIFLILLCSVISLIYSVIVWRKNDFKQ